MDEIDEKYKVQFPFLSGLADSNVRCVVFLTNGIKLQGFLIDHDLFTVTLALGGCEQLIYKHAMATIMPWSKEAEKKRSEDYRK